MAAALLGPEVFLLWSLLASNVRGLGHFENVALNTPCKMSSRLSWFSGEHLPGVAVNGDTSGDFTNTTNCIHTLEGDGSPWWEVDLGRPYPVHSVVVWARTSFADRMKGCVISVDGQKCYRFDNTPVSRKTNVTCTSGVLNRSVIRVSKDITGLSADDRTINICEFQVLSCSEDFWGSGCDRRCGNCSDGEVCDKVTGHCSSCPLGLQPPLCDTGCKDGTFGQNCTHNCGEGCEDVCNKVSGHCSCKSGWDEPSCTECDNGTFGKNCIQSCSKGCDTVCNKVSGHCTCKPGWLGLTCEAEERTEGEPISTGILVGAVVGTFCASVVLFVAVLVVVRWLRSRSQRTNGDRANGSAFNGSGINSQQAMPATTRYQTERSPVPEGEVYVVEGESRREPPRESSASSADQPYEIFDRDREHTYEKPQMYVNTGDHHLYSDLKT